MLDYHLHSDVSFDGHASRKEMALAARNAWVPGLCFTDHDDVVNEKNELVPRYDWAPARAAHREAREALGPDFLLGYGLELGNAPAHFAGADEALREPGIDFVLGSIHNGSRALQWQDYYFVTFTSLDQCYYYLDDYFDALDTLMAWGNFDSLAHLPYPLRYMIQRDGQPVDLARYTDRIDGLLRQVIRTGKALEVNSGKSETLMPEYGWLLDRYKALGGTRITVGTDAHRPQDVGRGLAAAYDLIRAKGFHEITYFVGRQAHTQPL